MTRGDLLFKATRVIRVAFERAALLVADRRLVYGIPVAFSLTGKVDDSDDLAGRVQSALHVISTVQPRRLQQARRYLKLIWVRRYPRFRAAYSHPLGACILDTSFLRDRTFLIEQIAASIIHETTHARVERRGISYDWVTKARVERLCRQAELDFGNKLKDGAVVVARASEHLALDNATLTGSPEADFRSSQEAAITLLNELEIPSSLRRFYLWVVRRWRAP